MKKIALLLFSCMLLFSSIYAQTETGEVGFYVKAYKNGEWYHAGGVTVYIGTDNTGVNIGTTRKVQSCNSNMGNDIITKLQVGEYNYYAESGDDKNIWTGSFQVHANRKTRIPLQVDFSKY